ncbi:hypothetical protein AJ87_21145 [Rhizobium yanglingense]|nr:hypothetical protein AJ87_21145 [Rhizobium yanglingense]
MVGQGLASGVKHGDDTDLGTQPLGGGDCGRNYRRCSSCRSLAGIDVSTEPWCAAGFDRAHDTSFAAAKMTDVITVVGTPANQCRPYRIQYANY